MKKKATRFNVPYVCLPATPGFVAAYFRMLRYYQIVQNTYNRWELRCYCYCHCVRPSGLTSLKIYAQMAEHGLCCWCCYIAAARKCYFWTNVWRGTLMLYSDVILWRRVFESLIRLFHCVWNIYTNIHSPRIRVHSFSASIFNVFAETRIRFFGEYQHHVSSCSKHSLSHSA